MDIIDRATLLELIEADPQIAVSIYMPLHSAEGSAARQDPVRLKNLLSDAEDQLRALDADLREAEELLAPLRAQAETSAFWKQDGAALAAFLAPGFKRTFFVGTALPEKLSVDTRFHVAPLIPALAQSGRFYVLQLSENNNRLILCEGDKIAAVELAGAPASLNDSMMLEDRENQLQMHSAGSPQSGLAAGAFHGGGNWNDYEKEQIPLYVKQINDAIVTMLSEDQAPLLVATEERMFAFYKSASTYPNFVAQPLLGSFEDFTPQAIAQQAWPLAEPHVVAGAQQKLARMRQVAGTEKGVMDPVQVVAAAVNGRIDTLFIDPQGELWGSFDPSTQAIEVHKQVKETASTDLLELAVRETLSTSGLVLTLEGDPLLEHTPVAALLRWPGGTQTDRT
jgi:hypothetical protein